MQNGAFLKIKNRDSGLGFIYKARKHVIFKGIRRHVGT